MLGDAHVLHGSSGKLCPAMQVLSCRNDKYETNTFIGRGSIQYIGPLAIWRSLTAGLYSQPSDLPSGEWVVI